MTDAVAINIIVFGRGLIHDDADYRLTLSSAERVEALLAYIEMNKSIFGVRRGNVVFSGGWAGAGQDLPRPPERFREAALMLDRAKEADIAGHKLVRYAEIYSEIESDSTLENLLRTQEADYFGGITFTACNPLGLVAHKRHLNRIDYLVRKVFNLPPQAVTHIVAPGLDRTSSGIPESLILLVTRMTFIGAKDVSTLRRRQRILMTLNRAVARRVLPDRRRIQKRAVSLNSLPLEQFLNEIWATRRPIISTRLSLSRGREGNLVHEDRRGRESN